MPEGSQPRSRRQAQADCRADRHRYGAAQPIGGGIVRRTCTACGAISIDLTAADRPRSSSLFRRRAKLRTSTIET